MTTNTTHRKIEHPTIMKYHDYGDEQKIFKIDANLFVQHLNSIKKRLIKTRVGFWYEGQCYRTEYHVRFLINDGHCNLSKPYSNEVDKVFPTYNLSLVADFQIDVMILLKVLRTFKKERVTILVTDKQLIIRQDRNRVAINFVGVKDV